MNRLEILSVELHARTQPAIHRFRLEQPKPRQRAEIYSFSMTGWVLGKSSPVTALSVTHQGDRIKLIPVNLFKPRVVARFPMRPEARTAGFDGEVGVVGLPEVCTIDVAALLATGEQVPFAAVQLRRGPLESTYTPDLQPLMITSLGRSGSTWSMRLFGEHPGIVINRVHPYEVMAANYWIHLSKVLTDPANHRQSTAWLGFADRHWVIGQNPYFGQPNIEHESLRAWFGYDLVARTAGYVQQNIDEYYLRLAEAQRDPRPRYFAEKNRANHIPRMFFEIYPGARELFVIRDFRDMLVSMLSFNRRRGYVGVGPMDAEDDADFVRKLRPSIARMLEAYEERADRSLLLKYEDLVLAPRTALRWALDYLGLDSDPGTIARMQRDAARPGKRSRLKALASRVVPRTIQQRSPELFARLRSHRTSGADPSTSVGRWKTDLPPDLLDLAHESFGDLLEKAGYPLDS